MIQEIDGFKYIERQASNKEGCDGVRFKYVCLDSLQNRKARAKREKEAEDMDSTSRRKSDQATDLAMHDCGGAIHIKFSTKREAVNVVYVHNPIHRDIESRPVNSKKYVPCLCLRKWSYIAMKQQIHEQDRSHAQFLDMSVAVCYQANPTTSLLQDISTNTTNQSANGTLDGTSNGTKSKKRKQNKKDHHVEADTAYYNAGLNMSTSPEASTKKRRKKDAVPSGPSSSATKKSRAKQQKSPTRARQKATAKDSTSVPVQAVRGKCLRCREKGIKCNEAKPNCNQCLRGLWACQYEAPDPKKRSKNGCLNCKSRRRKCTEEKPACAYCLKIDDDCMYGECK